MFSQTSKLVTNVRRILGWAQGGIHKRIDENRELLELLRKEAPDFVAKHTEVLSWLQSQDDFLCELADVVPISEGRFLSLTKHPPRMFPRPWPDDAVKSLEQRRRDRRQARLAWKLDLTFSGNEPAVDQVRAIIKSVGSLGTNYADAPEYALAGWRTARAAVPQSVATLTDEQIIDAFKSVCCINEPGFADAFVRYRAEALAMGRAVERAMLAAHLTGKAGSYGESFRDATGKATITARPEGSKASQKDGMRHGFEEQRSRGVNVDWFTWQIAWFDAHTKALKEALIAVEAEQLVVPPEDHVDRAYDRAVSDCAHAIRALGEFDELGESEGNHAPIGGHHAMHGHAG